MTSYHQGFLYLTNAYGTPVEVINEARTAALLEAAIPTVPEFGNVLLDAGCGGLAFAPCTMAADGTVQSWLPLDMAITAAPWFVATSDASYEACGFYIEEWTGLDGAAHSRNSTPTGQPRGGAYLGPQTSAGRVMALNVILVGTSERGLNHLFRWLESTLLGCCERPDKPSMYVREVCPTVGLDDGLARLDGVGLLGGPTWEAAPVEEAGMYLRKVSFTLGSESPCFFRSSVDGVTQVALRSAMPTTTSINGADYASCSSYIGLSPQAALAINGPAYGTTSPLITITSPREEGKFLPPLRIVGYLNPAGLATSRLCEMFPIGAMILGTWITSLIPSGLEIVIDVGAQTIKYRDPMQTLEWSDGSSLLVLSYVGGGLNYPGITGDGAAYRRWFGFSNCEQGVVVVEPNLVLDTSYIATTVSTWTTQIQTVDRFGCC